VPAASRRTSSTSHAACMSCRAGAGQRAAPQSRPHRPRAPFRRRGGRAGRTACSTASTAERLASRPSCSSNSMPWAPGPRFTATHKRAACEARRALSAPVRRPRTAAPTGCRAPAGSRARGLLRRQGARSRSPPRRAQQLQAARRPRLPADRRSREVRRTVPRASSPARRTTHLCSRGSSPPESAGLARSGGWAGSSHRARPTRRAGLAPALAARPL